MANTQHPFTSYGHCEAEAIARREAGRLAAEQRKLHRKPHKTINKPYCDPYYAVVAEPQYCVNHYVNPGGAGPYR
jgi:hypothetical protein